MTLLNVWVGADRALVGVDTCARPTHPKWAALTGVPPQLDVTKVFPLAAAGAIVAGRGVSGLIWAVHLRCLATPGDFDTLVAAMPTILRWADRDYRRMVPFWSRWGADGALQLALVGWSPRQERMCGAIFSRTAAGHAFERLDLGGEGSEGGDESDDWIAPWEPEQGEAPVPDTPGNMLDLVIRQMNHAPADAPIGGRLIVAELRRDVLTVQTLAELGAPASHSTCIGGT